MEGGWHRVHNREHFPLAGPQKEYQLNAEKTLPAFVFVLVCGPVVRSNLLHFPADDAGSDDRAGVGEPLSFCLFVHLLLMLLLLVVAP